MGAGPHGSSRGSPSAQLPRSLAPSSRAIPLEQRGLGRCGVTYLKVASEKGAKKKEKSFKIYRFDKICLLFELHPFFFFFFIVG